jgi:CheY-like chemotaxis protein
MPDGGAITITTEQIDLDERESRARGLDHPGPYVRLNVWDTGVGMDAGTLQHVFEPFFTTKEPGKGTGLGLATAYGLIRQNEGAVQVYSEVGQGTTFRIYFPHHANRVPSREMEKKVHPPGGTETVLLAEDDEKVRGLSEFILTNAGYTVHVASDGKEAVDLFARLGGRIDLLFLDAVMPGLDGRAVWDRCREGGFRGPVLFASGYAAESLTPDQLEDESVQFLQKPFTRNELLHGVRSALDGGPGG